MTYHGNIFLMDFLINKSMSNKGTQKKQSSTTTVLSMFNTMVGGAMLTFPVLFRTTGIISSTIVLTISCIISYITCRVFIFHMKDEDDVVEHIINRLMGPKWQKFWRLVTGIYLMLLCIIYMDLIVDQIYSILIFFFDKDEEQGPLAPKNAFVWNKFSQQWLACIMFFPFLYLIFIKNMSLLIRLAGYGAYAIMMYLFFVIYKFFQTILQESFNMNNINWFSLQIGDLAGTAGLAFTVHTVVVTLIKPNENQDKNIRDLTLSYGVTFVFYMGVSVLGGIAISDKKCDITLVDCYLKQWSILIVEISYFSSTMCVFPCTLSVSRTRFLQAFSDKVQPKTQRLFNVIYMIVGIIFVVISPYMPIPLMMNITGAIICYCFVYLFPSVMHYKCLYTPHEKHSVSSLEETIITEKDDDQIEDEKGDKEGLVKQKKIKKSKVRVSCSHDSDYAHSKPKWLRVLIYLLFNMIGAGIGAYGLYSCVRTIMGEKEEVSYWI